ncbi:unnamed protein product, partial [Oncorhynchus mykiss]
ERERERERDSFGVLSDKQDKYLRFNGPQSVVSCLFCRLSRACRQSPRCELTAGVLSFPCLCLLSEPQTIKATSPLGDPRVTYNLEDGMVPETNMPVRFYLTPNREDGSASILVAEPLDYETTRNFILRVRAQNVAAVPLAAFTTVHLNITDVNDNVPFFTSSIYEASVTEGAEVGTFVTQVSSNDLDLGLNGKVTERFGIMEIQTTILYQHSETFCQYTSWFLAISQKSWERAWRLISHSVLSLSLLPSDTAYVRVFISDVNDNKPVFAQTVYEVDVDEDADVGFAILTVSANDEDEGANAKLRYQITSGNTGGVFDVEPEVGTIFIAQPLDYERNKGYKLLVLASDGKWEDYADVMVNVVNKNDEAPVFTVNEYYGSVTEELDGSPVFVLQVEDCNDHTPIFIALSQPPAPLPEDVPVGSSVARLTASDSDSGQNKEITYKILQESDILGQFSHHLVILATDHGSPALTGSTVIQLTLLDVNDNGPEFEAVYTPVVWENVAGPQLVRLNQTSTLLRAIDRDSAENGSPFYFSLPLELNHSNDFYLQDNGNGTATITALRAFDRERQKEFHLQIIMSDSGHPPKTVTNTLTITIGDENDHAHQAGEKEIFVNSHRGRMPTTVLGKIYAPDPDDWDNKTYAFEGHVPNYFLLNKRTGFLIIKENAPPGSYEFQVRVSDGVWPDAVSGVTVYVRELRDEAIYNSGSLRLAGAVQYTCPLNLDL